MRQFIEDHFNTLLATLIFIGLCVLAIHAFHHGEQKFADFATDQAKEFGGALLMALTGARVMNGKPATPAAPSPAPAPVQDLGATAPQGQK